ncbi:hybrid sensor histidine kinase/response regulator [Neptunitalea lumnitzerae]|uniref:histidine kinase n=1 Tax=Neptunitalea lumnitzerae TaxID=2965509 RepID=A0ABQ5MJK6_9FLAO|nr:hybrid sensor histidine kinase/response regulator transcription factor [Neptunitalea sp. Y10]GLB49596.1 hybrid sensor histidine kinase/response regulator [Neptunitalea sp. Y10]
MKKVIILTLICSYCSVFYGQDYFFKHLQVEDGLSQNSVISMLQDNKGFMWFGTKDGLNRYDGYNFKIFHHIPGDTTSIGSNFIRCIHEFNDYLWVGTDTGLFRYDERTESFSLIKETQNQPILDIEYNIDGSLWVIANGVLLRIVANEENLMVEKYDQFYANFVTHTPSGNVYISSPQNVFKYIPENNSFQKIIYDTDFKSSGTIITIMKCNGNNELLIGTKDNGAFLFTIDSHIMKPILPEKENPLFVRDFLIKDKNELWIASESGLFIVNIENGDYLNFKKDYGNPYSLSDNAIYALVEDKEGGVWISSYFGGVNYFPKPYTPFTRYFPMVGANSLSGNAVREIEKDINGNLWIGTEDAGLNKLNVKTGKFTNYTYGKNKGNLAHYNIHGLLAKENELWIGTFEHGLDVMDIETEKVIRHYGTGPDEGGLRSNFILHIYQSSDTSIYVLTSFGVHKYIPASDSFELVSGFPEVYHYTYFLEDHNGTFWAGTYWDGLYYYNPKTKKKGVYRYESSNVYSISSNVINGIFEDSKNQLWITTENGLNLYIPDSDSFKRYTRSDGFPSNVTYAILEDDEQQLWISSSNGLVEFNPETEDIKTFTRSSGLLSDQFNYCSSLQTEDGEMYFGSVKGMISFNPNKFTQNTFNPSVYITDIFINNDDVQVGKNNSPLDKSILFSDEIILNNQQSSFKLEFASLSFTAPEMTRYWYQLEGLNDNWIPLEKNHEVNFTELPFGTYTFRVKALNNYKVWTKENAVLKITILPPFYLSKVAILIYLLALIWIAYFGLRTYHRYTRRKSNRHITQLQNEKEKEIYEAKIEFFTNVAHEIRTPLTLIKSPLEKLIKQKYKSPEIPKNLDIMEKNTIRLLNLVNELLDFRKVEMKNVELNFEPINISEIIRETLTRFSQLIQERNLQCTINIPEKAIIAFADEEAFRKILSNLFGNAIKYSAKKVILTLDILESSFKVTIKNDGDIIPVHLHKRIFEPFFRVYPHTPTPNIGTGIGLSLAYSLTQLHNGSLYINESEANMNTFILELPLHQNEKLKAISPSDIEYTSKQSKTNTIQNKHLPLIIIAEDNKELADFMLSELAENFNILLAKNGEEAWEMVLKNEVQLIVSDVMMPVKNGITLCKDIKSNEKTNHIPVILLTAKTALNAKIEGLESGADAYITKPFSMDYLLIQISNLIENRRNILGHYSSSPLAYLKSVATTNTDKEFLTKLDRVIQEHLKEQSLNVDKIANYMNMSRSTLYRNINELSDISPNELINLSRLKKAAHLIKTTNMKIYEIAEMVGYKSQTSFGRNFQKHFGMTPTSFEKANKE